MNKKVALGAKPIQPTNSADQWVAMRSESVEANKRLTIDIPESLHRQVKTQCAIDNTSIADVVRDLLIQKYRKS